MAFGAGLGGSGRFGFEVVPGAEGGPERVHVRGFEQAGLAEGCRATEGRAFPQAWTLHPAWRQCRALWLWELPPAPLAPVLLEASFTFYFNPNV